MKYSYKLILAALAIGILSSAFGIPVSSVTKKYFENFDFIILQDRIVDFDEHKTFYMFVSAIIGLLIYLISWLIRPMQIINDPDTIQQIPNGKLVARAARSRKTGKVPPFYPTGWYRIEASSSVKVGDVKYLEFFGEHLVLFRGENGKASILDAYCPHLGANLAVGGRVVGNCIECPFHGWQFEEDGKCSHIPYTDKVPEVAKTRAWPVEELNGSIHIWYDALGRLENIPWNLPDLKEIKEGQYVMHGVFENFVEAHIQEIPENGSDVAHLGVLHVPFALNKYLPFISHRWTANWKAGEAPEDYTASIHLTQSLLLFGKSIPFASAESDIRQIGPGVVYITLYSAFGKFLICEHVTPLQPLYQKINHVVWGPKNVFSRNIAKVLLAAFSEQFTRDVAIWNNKTFINKPIIVKGDGNINGFRRWYSKFYPEATDKTNATTQDLNW